MFEVSVCPKCGEVNFPAFDSDKVCHCTWVGFLKRPHRLFFEVSDSLFQDHSKQRQAHMSIGINEFDYLYWYEKFFKNCDQYDNNLFKEHLQDNQQRDLCLKQRLDEQASRPTVKCPYCGSLRTTKISTSSRVASSLTLGLASNKIGKNYQCNDCKATF